MKDLISVIIPVYNAERTLRTCIEMLLSQTYENAEFIFVNDGSNDESSKIILEYKTRDSRIKVIEVVNGGVSKARNIGIKHANGQYVSFVDADDIVDCNFLKMMYSALKETGADVVACPYDTNMLPMKVNSVCTTNEISKEEYIKELMIPEMNIAAFVWNRMYNTQIIKKYGITFNENVRVCEDTLFNYEIAKNVQRIVFINLPLYHYQLNSSGAMFGEWFNPNKLTANTAFEIMLSDVKGGVKSFIEVGCMHYNIIMLKQIIKQKYDISNVELNRIQKNLRLNISVFLKSKINIKYKFAILLMGWLPLNINKKWRG